MAATETAAIVDRLQRFGRRNWKSEPGDITRLRSAQPAADGDHAARALRQLQHLLDG